MPVKKGDKIKVDYEGTLEDGTVFDSSTHGDHSHPLEFEVGSGQLIKGFDEGVIGMEKGEEKTIKLESSEAYGDPKPELVKKFPREQLPKDQEPKEGMTLLIKSQDGNQLPAKITKVDDKEVTIDLNHPLASKTLNFKIKVIEISS
ncbi:MAG: peptidylprolyl isomerase [Candidatus Nanoarchaeia archaeon]|jgi:FKBP-type peptidyl-prolyl cis-trans isomerase 2|nr:peptidylprolyl isomerase [Candidatus Nanoarchaeia archaeon]|tara:strand:+ start:57745 stop:58182 length:438 start_codon:yes stop_codon:yes gene_type:complete